MSKFDYICCKKCKEKILYDGNHELKRQLSEYFDNMGILCPYCVVSLNNSMSIEKVQEMALELANEASLSGYDGREYYESDITEFIEEWRRNNDS